ncbi:hypothetical protein GWK47_016030 [Chionoecetes opilio]|uniref:Uncharacterized protein n=1 Tax=Chionoecetes opilio TaxID=41210 RepID=A0A8J4XSV0_CHIOP|nr:hypothetical protein GWK47_016030 [Chionoecetes opilio]
MSVSLSFRRPLSIVQGPGTGRQLAIQLEREAFKDPPPLVLHWDSKLLPKATSKWASEDRIAVVATGQNFEEILGVPSHKMERDKKSQARFSRRSSESGAREQIIGLTFRYDGLEQRHARRRLCTTWKILRSLLLCWHAGTTYWRLS